MSDSRGRMRLLLPSSRTTWFLAAALLLAAAAALPLLAGPGLLNTRGGGDSPFLLQRLQQLEAALRDGHFPVRWMPDANYGYGYPFYNFYAPLSIYITAVFRLIGFSYVAAIQLSQLAGFLAAAWGMFLLGRRWWGSDWAGLLASAAYTAAPFHLVNVYVRGDSLAEFWAMALYPWVILGVDGVYRASAAAAARRAALARLALAYAALILSHNISALIFSPFLLLYILLRAWQPAGSESPRANLQSALAHLQRPLLALLLAFALAAWFFLPALAEQSLAQLGPVTEGYFHYSNHFRGADLVQPRLLFDPNPDGGAAFRMGLVQALTAVLGLLILAASRPAGTPARRLFTWAAFWISTLMITPLSRPLWDTLPLLPFTQFPWRFLSVQAFAGALAAGGIAWLPGSSRWPAFRMPRSAAEQTAPQAERAASLRVRNGIILAPAVVGLLLVAGLGGLRPDYLRLTDADVSPARLAQYEWFTGNIGTTVSAEYLPPAVNPRPVTSAWLAQGERDRLQVLSGEVSTAQLNLRRATRQTWTVAVQADAVVVFPTLYWPGWRAEVDGRAAAVDAAPGSGLIRLPLPAGAQAVTLRLARTPIRLAAELLSLLALLGTAWLLRPRAVAWRRVGRTAVFPALALALLLLTIRLWPRVNRTQDDLTWDFAQLGYLHHDSDGVPFSSGAALWHYTYSQDVLAPGETLQVALDGSWPDDTVVTLALFSPAVNRYPAVPPLAVAAQPAQASRPAQPGRVTLALVLPENAPTGLYVPRLTLAGATPLLPSGQSRGPLFLRPVRVVRRSGAAGLPDQPLAVRLVGQPASAPDQPAALPLPLAWYTAQPLAQNLNVSLRLLDAAGGVLAQADMQPGYGFQPSSGWPVGQWVNDWLALPLPAALPETAVLQVQLYELGGQTRLIRRLGRVAQTAGGWVVTADEPQFTLPEGVVAETAVFQAGAEPLIRLRGYTLVPAATGAVSVTLVWEALAAMPASYTRFVHLLDADGRLAAQNDAMPLANSYPTSQWQVGEIVADPVVLDVTGLPPGRYTVVAGFYENLGDRFPRLTAVGEDGARLPDDRVALPEPLVVGSGS